LTETDIERVIAVSWLSFEDRQAAMMLA